MAGVESRAGMAASAAMPEIHIPTVDYGPILRPHERNASAEALSVAHHEANHLLLAHLLGVQVIGVSVISEGNSLGRTSFAGHINATAFQVIAAGGACETPFGHAEGYSADMGQVYGLSFAHGGYAAETAISHAGALLGSIPTDVRNRVAEIIASMGEITGTEIINKAIKIAAFESSYNINSALSEQAERIKELREKVLTPEHQASIDRGERTVIEVVGGGTTIIIKITRDEEGREHKECTYCNGKDGHKLLCPLFVNKDPLEKPVFTAPYPEPKGF